MADIEKDILDEAVATYRKCASIPTISNARMCWPRKMQALLQLRLESTWCELNLECGERRKFSRRFHLARNNDGEIEPEKHFEDNFPRQLNFLMNLVKRSLSEML